MINRITSNSREYRDFGWLKTHWHFSFGDYIDRSNVNFGPLRVFNDDIIEPGGTFDTHPHRDMEIISIVTRGQLEHRDSTGAHGIVRPCEIQTMSAGSGIEHSERNPSATESTRLMQLWIMPRTRGLKPRWQQRVFDPAGAADRLLPIVSDGSIADTLPIDRDAVIYLSQLAAGKSISHTGAAGRRQYLFVVAGGLTVNGTAMAAGDQARIEGETELALSATADAHIVLIDLP